MTDMHFMYGRANSNAYGARRLYAEAFPNRALPSDKLFSKLHLRLVENGSFSVKKHDAGRPRSVSTPEAELEVLRRSGDLREQQLYPFHIQQVQALITPDYDSRLAFCRFILRKVEENPDFAANILFTDETIFTDNGIINFHNH
ncbi:hypothetical protein X777_06135, partial [Ooceraea biroi]